jgi:hypothetical protein
MLHLAPLAMETFKSISYRSHTIFEEYIFPPFSVIIRDSCMRCIALIFVIISSIKYGPLILPSLKRLLRYGHLYLRNIPAHPPFLENIYFLFSPLLLKREACGILR